MRLILLYSFFALLSMGTNLGSQKLVFLLYQGPFSLYAGMFIGTGLGLVVKYILDKRFIFRYQTKGHLHNLGTFLLYTSMGVVTTAVFWGTEILFDALFGGDGFRLLGGFIGLVIGYTAKFFLDRTFVFKGKAESS